MAGNARALRRAVATRPERSPKRPLRPRRETPGGGRRRKRPRHAPRRSSPTGSADLVHLLMSRLMGSRPRSLHLVCPASRRFFLRRRAQSCPATALNPMSDRLSRPRIGIRKVSIRLIPRGVGLCCPVHAACELPARWHDSGPLTTRWTRPIPSSDQTVGVRVPPDALGNLPPSGCLFDRDGAGHDGHGVGHRVGLRCDHSDAATEALDVNAVGDLEHMRHVVADQDDRQTAVA